MQDSIIAKSSKKPFSVRRSCLAHCSNNGENTVYAAFRLKDAHMKTKAYTDTGYSCRVLPIKEDLVGCSCVILLLTCVEESCILTCTNIQSSEPVDRCLCEDLVEIHDFAHAETSIEVLLWLHHLKAFLWHCWNQVWSQAHQAWWKEK